MSAEGAGRPLLTFALFTYNQERFVREAVEAAFSQSWQPLEIILSDDCSPDGTYAIMQEMCAAYRGPHRVRLNRTSPNAGTFHHVMQVGRMARGELVVVAAGDDISLPERVEVLQRHRAATGAVALCSDHDVIDEAGRILRRRGGFPRESGFQRYLDDDARAAARLLQGSTAAYAKHVFDLDTTGFPRAFAEDNILNFLLALRGERIEQVPESLILYREHGAAVHNRPRDLPWRERERHSVESARRNLPKMRIFRMLIEREKAALGTAQRRRFRADERRIADIAAWPDLPLRVRLARIARSAAAGEARATAWMLLRLLGPVEGYQPGGLLHALAGARNGRRR